MKFIEAAVQMKEGKKIRRNSWAKDIFLQIEEGICTTFVIKKQHYTYNNDTIMSFNWFVENDENEYHFYEIVEKLEDGCKARMGHWNGSFIYYDAQEKELFCDLVVEFSFSLSFCDLIENDWEVI